MPGTNAPAYYERWLIANANAYIKLDTDDDIITQAFLCQKYLKQISINILDYYAKSNVCRKGREFILSCSTWVGSCLTDKLDE
jgi:hypothetical protein